MTEIQIVGPKGSSATKFKKFFDDDIVIEPNSKIYLNHAVLNKNEGVRFNEDQAFGFSIKQDNVYGNLMSNPVILFTIPEGDYTYQELKKFLVDNINSKIIQNSSNGNTFSGYEVLDENDEDDKPFIGFEPTSTLTTSNATEFGNLPISINLSHSGVIIKQSSITTAEITSFAMHSKPYFQNSVYTNDPEVRDTNSRVVYFLYNNNSPLSIKDIEDDAGTPKICMGFYGKEYALDNTVGTGSRTDDTAIVLVEDVADALDKVPTMFFQAVIEQRDEGQGDKAYLIIYQALSTAGGKIKNWTTQQEEINNVEEIHKVELASIPGIDINQQLRFEIYTYQDQQDADFEEEYKTYFGVNIVHNDTIKIFDSADVRQYLDIAFFTGLGTGTDVIKRSQRALYPCFGTNTQNYGYEMNYTGLTGDDSILIKETSFATTSELGKVLGIFSEDNLDDTTGFYASNDIYPNPAERSQINNLTAIPTTFEDYYRMDSYVIKINNLPIQSFKTNEVKGNRGYKQSVLATIPTPFQNANLESRVNIDGQDYLATTYNSYYPLIKEMKNQRLVINNFDVEIVRLSDDKQATDLDQIALNFTIQSPMI